MESPELKQVECWLASTGDSLGRRSRRFSLNNMTYLDPEFFSRDTLVVARDLIGATLVVGRCEGRIVETEAYTTDAASHSVTRRNQASTMRETFGRVYVYFIYGMYYCLNFTTEIGRAHV